MFDSIKATLQGLLNGADDITALNGGKYLTTRLSNTISFLRDQNIDIITKRVKTKNKKSYGVYILVNSKENREKAERLLHYYQNINKVADTITEI